MSDVKKASKATSSSKRIMDVAHPGKSAPSSTSKPVIVTNRPLMKDPMMAESPEKDSSEVKIIGTPGKIKIQPLTAPVVEEADSTPETVEVKTPNKPAPEPAPPEVATEDKSAEESKPADVTDDQPVAEKKTGEKTDTPEPEEAAEDKPDAEKAPDEIDAKAAEEAAKHQAAIQALTDSKKYYLPVNSIEKRRTKRVIALGIVLSVLLALAWADIALDAGLIQISGVKPVTHFFSN
jgi:hypothetical protein